MKIAFDMTNPYIHGTTGIGTYAYSLIRSLSELYQNDKFLLTVRDSRIKKVLKNWELFSRLKLRAENISHHIAFKGFLLPYGNVDIWHGVDNWIPDKYTGKSKKILTVHDLVVFTNPHWLGKSYVKNMQKKFNKLFSVNYLDHIIAVSKQTCEEIISYFPHGRDKITVIPEGVSDFWYPHNEPFYLPNDLKYFLFVITIEPRKNFSNVEKDIKKLKIKNIKLVVVVNINGEDPGLMRNKNIIWLGYAQKEYLRSLYSKSLGLIYVSLYEGFGLPPFEALACNCPVIVSKNIPCSNFLPDKFKVEAEDVDRIYNKMLALIDIKNKSQLYKIVKPFTWDQIAEKTYSVYEKL